MTIKCKNNSIEYILSRNAKKNINLSVKIDGKVYVSAPKRVSTCEIERFISEKKDWIEKEKRRMKKLNIKKVNEEFSKRERVVYKGYEYNLIIIEGDIDKVEIDKDTFYITIKSEYLNDNEHIKKVFEKWVLDNAKITYEKMVDNLIKELNLKKPNIQIRKMKSRWGSCIPAKNKITLNLNLMYVPNVCAEYVVAHELSHLLVPNHSKLFYKVLESIMPDWKKRKEMLNNTFAEIL